VDIHRAHGSFTEPALAGGTKKASQKRVEEGYLIPGSSTGSLTEPNPFWLSVCLYLVLAIPVSLPCFDYPCIFTMFWLSLYCYHVLAIPVSLPCFGYHCIFTMFWLFLYLCHVLAVRVSLPCFSNMPYSSTLKIEATVC
jgi:hypothetical protein